MIQSMFHFDQGQLDGTVDHAGFGWSNYMRNWNNEGGLNIRSNFVWWQRWWWHLGSNWCCDSLGQAMTVMFGKPCTISMTWPWPDQVLKITSILASHEMNMIPRWWMTWKHLPMVLTYLIYHKISRCGLKLWGGFASRRHSLNGRVPVSFQISDFVYTSAHHMGEGVILSDDHFFLWPDQVLPTT